MSPSGKSFSYETLVRYAQPYLAKSNDLFLRNLQALREMKSSPITIKIEQAGQVNVGEKQINVASDPDCPGVDSFDSVPVEEQLVSVDSTGIESET